MQRWRLGLITICITILGFLYGFGMQLLLVSLAGAMATAAEEYEWEAGAAEQKEE